MDGSPQWQGTSAATLAPEPSGACSERGAHGQLVGERRGELPVERERRRRVRQRVQHRPGQHLADRVEAVFERGHDPEVAAAAAEGPEQVGVLVVAGGQDISVGGDDLDGQEVVDGEAVLAHEPADAAAERQPGDPGGGDDPAGGGQSVDGRRPVELRTT